MSGWWLVGMGDGMRNINQFSPFFFIQNRVRVRHSFIKWNGMKSHKNVRFSSFTSANLYPSFSSLSLTPMNKRAFFFFSHSHHQHHIKWASCFSIYERLLLHHRDTRVTIISQMMMLKQSCNKLLIIPHFLFFYTFQYYRLYSFHFIFCQ